MTPLATLGAAPLLHLVPVSDRSSTRDQVVLSDTHGPTFPPLPGCHLLNFLTDRGIGHGQHAPSTTAIHGHSGASRAVRREERCIRSHASVLSSDGGHPSPPPVSVDCGKEFINAITSESCEHSAIARVNDELTPRRQSRLRDLRAAAECRRPALSPECPDAFVLYELAGAGERTWAFRRERGLTLVTAHAPGVPERGDVTTASARHTQISHNGRSGGSPRALRLAPYGTHCRRPSPCRGAVVRARSGARNRRYRMVRVTAGAQGISKRFVVSSRFALFPGGVPQTGQAGANSVFPLCGGWTMVVAFVPLASGHRSSRVPGGVAHPALALPVVLVVTGERLSLESCEGVTNGKEVSTRTEAGNDLRAVSGGGNKGQSSRGEANDLRIRSSWQSAQEVQAIGRLAPDPIAVSTIITGTGNTLAGVMVHDGSDRRKNEMGVSGRPQPLHGQVSDVLVDFGSWERRALSDGTIDHVEALEGVGILRELVTNVRPMVATAEHVATCMAGSQGMFSPRAIRGWNTAQGRMPANVIAFPVTRDRAAGD